MRIFSDYISAALSAAFNPRTLSRYLNLCRAMVPLLDNKKTANIM